MGHFLPLQNIWIGSLFHWKIYHWVVVNYLNIFHASILILSMLSLCKPQWFYKQSVPLTSIYQFGSKRTILSMGMCSNKYMNRSDLIIQYMIRSCFIVSENIWIGWVFKCPSAHLYLKVSLVTPRGYCRAESKVTKELTHTKKTEIKLGEKKLDLGIL